MRSGTGSGLHVRASRPHLLRIWTSGPDLPADFSGRVEKQCGARGPSISEDFPNVKKRLSSMCQAHSQPELLHFCGPRSATTSRAFDQASAPNRTAVESLIPGNRNIGNSKVCRGKYTIGIPKNIPSRLESAHADATSSPPEPQKDRTRQATEHEQEGTGETERIPKMPGPIR